MGIRELLVGCRFQGLGLLALRTSFERERKWQWEEDAVKIIEAERIAKSVPASQETDNP